jgi:small subunit ribosomal protein S21
LALADRRRALPYRKTHHHQTIEVDMPEIVLSDTDRIDWALKTFKRQMQKSGILRELRRRRHHVKPSEARQIKSKAAQRARIRAARRKERG